LALALLLLTLVLLKKTQLVNVTWLLMLLMVSYILFLNRVFLKITGAVFLIFTPQRLPFVIITPSTTTAFDRFSINSTSAELAVGEPSITVGWLAQSRWASVGLPVFG
jgi:hypothetical protein